jgi:iron(III) transport system substrate-binding protein
VISTARVFEIRVTWAVLAVLPLLSVGCTLRKPVWIYTSLPKEVIEELVEPLAAQVPDADVKWFEDTSEAVNARLAREWEGGGRAKADLVLTSDPFSYVDLRVQGRLLAYSSPAAAKVPAQYSDPDGSFTAVRLHAVVLGYNPKLLSPRDLPERWSDLTQPRWKNRLSMGNPLESSAHFMAVAMLSRLYGWDFFSKLRALGLVAENAGTAVVSRLESGERPLGVLPLENILKAEGRGSPILAIYPLDGVIIEPGPIAILRDSEHPKTAQKVYDWFFSAAAQNAFVHAGMYSPLPGAASPDRARPWRDLSLQLLKYDSTIREEIFRERDRIRGRFSEVVLH